MTERCSEKAQHAIFEIQRCLSMQYDPKWPLCQTLMEYIAALKSSVAELTQRAESAEALVRAVAATRPYESLVQQLYCSVCGSGPAACFAEINHLESCAWDRCKRHVEGQR